MIDAEFKKAAERGGFFNCYYCDNILDVVKGGCYEHRIKYKRDGTDFINTKREYSVFYKAGMNRTKGL